MYKINLSKEEARKFTNVWNESDELETLVELFYLLTKKSEKNKKECSE